MNDFQLLGGFGDWLTDELMDIGGCRVAFATENEKQPSVLIELDIEAGSLVKSNSW